MEKSGNGFVFHIGVNKTNSTENEMISFSYSYKIFSSITLNLADIHRDSGFRLDCNSNLVYELDIFIKNIHEKVSTSGTLENYAKKIFMKENDQLDFKEMIKIVGFFFEKTDCSLRNHELKNVLKSFGKQASLIFKP